MTNGDRIRNMTDEALAGIVLMDFDCNRCMMFHEDEDGHMDCHDRCYEGVLEWLKQETDNSAYWINSEERGQYVCSACNVGVWRVNGIFDYCPHCGAKMKKEAFRWG